MSSQDGKPSPADEFRQKVKEAFECVWGEQPSVEFDIELADEANRIDAMYEAEFGDANAS